MTGQWLPESDCVGEGQKWAQKQKSPEFLASNQSTRSQQCPFTASGFNTPEFQKPHKHTLFYSLSVERCSQEALYKMNPKRKFSFLFECSLRNFKKQCWKVTAGVTRAIIMTKMKSLSPAAWSWVPCAPKLCCASPDRDPNRAHSPKYSPEHHGTWAGQGDAPAAPTCHMVPTGHG